MYTAILGPVVGTICDNKIRILLECAYKHEACNNSLHITVSSGGMSESYEVPYKNGAMILRLELLTLDEIHTISFDNVLCDNLPVICSFNPKISSVAIISCDGDGVYHYNTGNKNKVWNLANKTSISHALHIGDQVYVDDAYDIGIKRIDETGFDPSKVFDDEIRKIYYASWFKCREKHVFLANHCNFMCIDDHDIYDNFTSDDFKSTRKYMDIFLDVAARIAGEYQIGLSQDVNVRWFSDLQHIRKVSFLENENMKFIIVNSRLTKTSECMFDDTTKQIIRENVITDKKLIFVDQVSPFIVSHTLTQFKTLFKFVGIDITDHITYKQCWIDDYNWLFRTLIQSNAREIVFATGDLHIGQNHDLISKKKQTQRIHCLTSSPMSSTVAMKPDSQMLYIADFISAQYTGFSYTNDFICYNNFVVIDKLNNKHIVVSREI
jgi:hypothetical protein